MESFETTATIREAIEGDEPLHCCITVAASDTGEAFGVEVTADSLDTFLRVYQLTTFGTALAEALLVAVFMENEVVFDNALETIEWLPTEAAAEAVGVPIVSGECDFGFVDLCLAAGAYARRSVWHMPEPARRVVRLNVDDRRKRKEVRRHDVITAGTVNSLQ